MSDSALRFEHLIVRGFRNLGPLELVPGARFNVLSGDNGQGKSNLLEALGYLSTLESFRGAPSGEMVQRGSEAALLAAKVSGGALPRTLKLRLFANGRPRELALDDKRPRTTASWRGVCPTVVFHPRDLELAHGGPEGRRTLLDSIAKEMDPNYAAASSEYTRALRSRNRLLKSEHRDRDSIRAFDPILDERGTRLVEIRRTLVAALAPVAQRTFASIFGAELPLTVRYCPRVKEQSIAEALARSFEKDLARGFTAEGPHADDLSLELDTRGTKHFASQGQQRMVALALKVAELEVLGSRTGCVPPLLLDDVSSELDRTRNRRFFDLLGQIGGQVFLTTTHPEFILLGGDERQDYALCQGEVRLVEGARST